MLLALLVPGCGGDEARPLTVSAAASLNPSLEEYARPFDARLSFGGSDALAAQIRRGVRPDVFASADPELVSRLHAEGLVEAPVPFASNELVVAAPSGSGVDAIADLADEGVRLAIGARGLPAGRYAREVLAQLPPGASENVRSEEPDVSGIVAKLRAGAADAGLVYSTDVAAAGPSLEAIRLPPALRPRIGYAAAVVAGSERAAEARRFVDGLADAPELRNAGFGSP